MRYNSAKDNTSVSVAAASTTLIVENKNRNGLIISVAAGGADMWLSFQKGNNATVPAAAVGTGMRIGTGGTVFLTGDTNFLGGINVIGTAAGPTLVGLVEL